LNKNILAKNPKKPRKTVAKKFLRVYNKGGFRAEYNFKERSIMDSVPNRSWLTTKHLTATQNNAFCTVENSFFKRG
jgi:hypothetical protein